MIAVTNINDFYRIYYRLLAEGKQPKWVGINRTLIIYK